MPLLANPPVSRLPLLQLGVTTMFSREGDFGNMYRMFVSHFINSFEHKAHLEVSEAGLEQPLEMGGELRGVPAFKYNYNFLFRSLPSLS